MSMDEEYILKKLRNDLNDFPHVLQLDIIMNEKVSRCESILEKLQSEMQRPCDFEDDAYKNNNFVSLLYFRLGRREKAFERNAEVRHMFQNNITALINLAFMKLLSGNELESNEIVEELNGLKEQKNYEDLIATARAEHGYCLGRIRPKFYKLAVQYYEQAIQRVPLNYIWKFGSALSSRRCLNMPKFLLNTTVDELKFYCETAFKHLSDIVRNCVIPSLCGRASLQLGELLQLFNLATYPVTPEIVNALNLEIRDSPEYCFHKALVIGEARDDEFILERCGKLLLYVGGHAKYNERLQNCYTYLQRAISLRPTAFSYENFAKILIKMAERSISPPRSSEVIYDRTNDEAGNEVIYDKRDGRAGIEEVFPTHAETDGVSGFPSPRNSQSPLANGEESDRYYNTYAMRQRPVQRKQKGKPRTQSEKFRQMRNSPVEVEQLDPADFRVKQAISFLLKAIEISKGTNSSAIYRLGLVYRQIGDQDSAMEQFRRITSGAESTAFDKTNAYEQHGYCLLELSKDLWHTEEKRNRYRKGSQIMMMLSIQQAAIMVSGTVTMGSDVLGNWQDLPSLKQLMSNGSQSLEASEKSAELSAMIDDHRELLPFYDHLCQINTDNPVELSRFITSFIESKDFQKAHTCLRLLLCTSEGQTLMQQDQNLIYQVYLGTVRHLMISAKSPREKEMLKFSCRSAFEHKHDKTSGDDDQNWDVFILNDPDQTDAEAAAIQSYLKNTCGLSVTRNDQEAPGGALPLLAEVKLIRSSRCLMIVLGEKDTNRHEHLVAYAQNNDICETALPSVIVTVLKGSCDLPLTFKRNILVKLPPGELSPDVLLRCFMSLLGLNFDTFHWLG